MYAHRQYAGHLWKNGERVEISRDDFVNDLFTDEALGFIRRHQEGPFFLYLAYTSPHAELRVPEDSAAEYRGRFEETPFVNEKADADWPRAEPRKWSGYRSQPEPRATYAGMVSRIDRDVGRILDLLADLDLDDDTIVFFTSDNGPHQEGGHDPHFFPSAEPLRGIKRDMYEGGIRVPMIVRAPGRVPAGRHERRGLGPLGRPAHAGRSGRGHDAPGRRRRLGARRAGGRGRRGGAPARSTGSSTSAASSRRSGWGSGRPCATGRTSRSSCTTSTTDLSEETDVAAENPEVVARLEEYLSGARTESSLWPLEETAR